ncbi:MAG: S9 family peptidase [Gammaproteobacteria bacterium]|nr:S9 family peptidase [Gammaproteobacteria bacterium]
MSDTARPITPPVADRRAHTFTRHGIEVNDPYHWLRDQSYPTVDDDDVIAYLEAENRYFDSVMEPHKELTQALFEEIKARQKPDDESVPLKDGNHYYQWQFAPGAQYRTWTRWPVDDPGAVETVLDEVALAEGHEYFALGSFSVSHDGRYLAYSTDTSGAERYTMFVKDLATGAVLPEAMESTLGDAVWTADNRTLFYQVMNENWRSDQVRRHTLGAPVEHDEVVYEEPDSGFWVDLGEASSKRYIVISTGDQVTNESYVLASDDPRGELLLVAARRVGHEYHIDHQGDRFVVRSNDKHRNFRLATAPENDFSESAWTTLIEGADDTYLLGFTCFDRWIAVEERVAGIDQVRILDREGGERRVAFPESVYSVGFGANAEYGTDMVRLSYASMVTPDTVYDYDMGTGDLAVRKVREIPSGYDPDFYRTYRISAPARDGASVPVSIVHRKDTPTDGSAPVYLYGYGAYGHAIDPSFSTSRISILDRGFVFAIAHIRGGTELGRDWYEQGKLKQRTNTFNDFVDVARHLIGEGLAKAGRIVIRGGSAGGELMGAVVNQAPELWGAVAAHVPFVDVLNTMLDESLPLTPGEWPEWGNPITDRDAFELIRSYSPYDQLAPGDYPPMLVTGGLNDPRVTYWEPAKYVAKLRTLKTDDDPLVLKTNMGAGHGGKSGRYDALYEVAEEYTFFLVALGMTGG